MVKEVASASASNKAGISSADLILWCLALVVALVLFLAGQAAQRIGRTATVVCLISIAALLVLPFWHLPWVRRPLKTGRRLFIFAFAFSFVLVLEVAFGFLVWPHVPISIRVTFQDSPVLTPSRIRHITSVLNEYHGYLISDIGLDLPSELPPIGVSPRGGPILTGGQVGAPSFYSHIIISEDGLDNDDIIRTAYSGYVFNKLLSPGSAEKSLQQVYEEAAWVFMCYFPASFGNKKVCASDVPGSKWIETMWDLRKEFGRSYTDNVLAYTLRMWPSSASGQWKTFDQFFMNKLLSGETVVNAGSDRFQAVRDIAKRRGMQLD